MQIGRHDIKRRFHDGSIDQDLHKARVMRRRTLVHRLIIRRLFAPVRRTLATAGWPQIAPRKPVANT